MLYSKDFYTIAIKEQHCTMLFANNGYKYDVFMGLRSFIH